MSRVLVTGGAGFIGSHLVAALLKQGHSVQVLDSLVSQVHGTGPIDPPGGADFVQADVRDRAAVDAALDGVEVVFHQAAEVGVGQSMYDIQRYVDANSNGVAVLLEAIVARRGQIKKLVVASSMSIYGEGAYTCSRTGEPMTAMPRPLAQLEARDWELKCPDCGAKLKPAPTHETKRLEPSSVYAVTKQDHEQLCLVVGRAYDIPTVALRYFNVYGPGQALSNPYTGAMAIFSSRLLNGQPPLIFEDGKQSRDFVNVADIVQANLLAMESDEANFQAINVGTGHASTILDVGRHLADGLGVSLEPEVVGKFREGDIRHCVADITRARELLGYEPRVALKTGIEELLGWVKDQQAVDGVEHATEELAARGLVR
jgi:dTDP-L-rhamnose 4-epimerase